MAPTITVTRKDNGVAEYEFKDGSKTITGKGFWDDATPWQGGSYNASYWLFGGSAGLPLDDTFRIGTAGKNRDNPIPDRTNIVFHGGSSTGSTEGCLVVTGNFIDDVIGYLRNEGQAPGYIQTLINRGRKDFFNSAFPPVAVNVTGDFSYDVSLSLVNADQEYTEGDNIQLEISLTGNGQPFQGSFE